MDEILHWQPGSIKAMPDDSPILVYHPTSEWPRNWMIWVWQADTEMWGILGGPAKYHVAGDQWWASLRKAKTEPLTASPTMDENGNPIFYDFADYMMYELHKPDHGAQCGALRAVMD